MLAVQDQMDGADAAQRLDDAHRQLLGDTSIQFELPPAGDPTSQPLPPQSPNYGPDPSTPPPQAPVSHTVPVDPSAAPPTSGAGPPAISANGSGDGIAGLMHVFLWIAAGVALIIILYWIFAFFRDRSGGGREKKPKKQKGSGAAQDVWLPEEAQAAQLLDEADILAQQGRYDEAARLLLHRSIGEIHAHRPDLVRPALTSRDIAGHPLLPRGPATAFARIAALVERSFFARRPLGADDWQDCRTAYREFAFADGWRG
jgi:hypothetical protein